MAITLFGSARNGQCVTIDGDIRPAPRLRRRAIKPFQNLDEFRRGRWIEHGGAFIEGKVLEIRPVVLFGRNGQSTIVPPRGIILGPSSIELRFFDNGALATVSYGNNKNTAAQAAPAASGTARPAGT